jgi:hypothetical protein
MALPNSLALIDYDIKAACSELVPQTVTCQRDPKTATQTDLAVVANAILMAFNVCLGTSLTTPLVSMSSHSSSWPRVVPIISAAFAILIASGTGSTQVTGQIYPHGWNCGPTDHGATLWSFHSGPASLQTLKYTGDAAMAWCIQSNVRITDGFMEVRLKTQAHAHDQSGGIVWHWRDASNYSYVRAVGVDDLIEIGNFNNSGHHNIKVTRVALMPGEWHALRADFKGNYTQVVVDGKVVIKVTDEELSGTGSVGVFTQSGSIIDMSGWGFDAMPRTGK